MTVDLTAVPISDLRAEIERRVFEAERVPPLKLQQHFDRWRRVCTGAKVRGLLKIRFRCERIPGDQIDVREDLTRLNVMWLDAIMTTRDRFKPRSRRPMLVRFRQVVSIVMTHAERIREIWRLIEDAYRHEAAELLFVRGRRPVRTHLNGSEDSAVTVP